MDGRIEQSGGRDVRDLGDQGPNQTFLRDGDAATCVEGIECQGAKRAEGVLNKAENTKREEEQVKDECGFASIRSAPGQSENHESVNQ